MALRFGLAYDAVFAKEQIESIQAEASAVDVERGPERLWCAVFGQPNVLITFRDPVTVSQPYGLSRRVRSIALLVDRPLELVHQLGLDP